MGAAPRAQGPQSAGVSLYGTAGYGQLDLASHHLPAWIHHNMHRHSTAATSATSASAHSAHAQTTGHRPPPPPPPRADTAKFAKFHRGMLEHGVYLAPSQYEAGFTGLQHTDEDIEATIQAAREVLKTL